MHLKKALSIFVTAALASTCLGLGLVGCAGQSAESNNSAETASESTTVRIGTMPTEDILPLWVAESEGMFEQAGLNAQIVSFDSAPALSAAITAGEVDMAMIDIMRAVKLCESGSPVILEWITLGTNPSQGRFGIMAPADAPYSTLQELAEQAQQDANSLAAKGVGVAANTVPEYVFDKLCEQAGIPEGAIPTQEVASLPERYSLMTSGNLAAAALPGSLLELGEANGMKLLADDTDTNGISVTPKAGDDPSTAVAENNISQSVMVATEGFANAQPEAIQLVAEVWDAAAQQINSDPTAYIDLLAEKANLNESIAGTYPISTYPMAVLTNVEAVDTDVVSLDESAADADVDGDGSSESTPTMAVENVSDAIGLLHPAALYVNPQIAWMQAKGYTSHTITYDETTGTLTIDE